MNASFQAGSIVFRNWHISKRIGAGSFGEVFEIQREDFGQLYRAALKVIRIPQNHDEYRRALEDGMSPREAEQYFYSVVENVVSEFAIMSRLKGTANVVSYEDHEVIRYADGIGWNILIRMELLTPLNCYTAENPFTRRDVIRLGIEMLRALELCQKFNIIHRDIKPENIFVSDLGDFKLGDFGIARTIEKTSSGMSKKGTYTYMAPEVYRGQEYGFSVDTYALGLVLYRLLNKNRAPFLPPVPEPITHNKQEAALVKRMSGIAVEKPFYAEGRLAEIVLKACAYDVNARYSSPLQMREELEAILYTEDEAEIIYPCGDDLPLPEIVYFSQTPHDEAVSERACLDETGKTVSVFDDRWVEPSIAKKASASAINEPYSDGTQAIFASRTPTVAEVVPGPGTKISFAESSPGEIAKPNSKNRIVAVSVIGLALVAAVLIFVLFYRNSKPIQTQNEQYATLISRGKSYFETDPPRAESIFLQAQQLIPERTEAYVSYAHALYCSAKYDKCISYIEDDLALGKSYDIAAQNQLSEILGSAYYGKGEYEAAASILRLSTAGGDPTLPAMRDYALSLARLGDIEAANNVLARMIEAGVDNELVRFVQAEIDCVQGFYQQAEVEFESVFSTTNDDGLKKRCLRSLAELYRDCSQLSYAASSPIPQPASKGVEVLNQAIQQFGQSYDSTLWELLGLAYYDSYNLGETEEVEYLNKAAEAFQEVITLGVQSDFSLTYLYFIHFEQNDYVKAETVLTQYEESYPLNYLPHALRGIMLIAIENEKGQDLRDFSGAFQEYEKAGELIRSSDDIGYYLQLDSLINQLPAQGAGDGTYVVEAGDTIYGIMMKVYETYSDELYAAFLEYNGKTANDTIFNGEELLIPPRSVLDSMIEE